VIPMKFGCTGRELGRAGHRGANNESVSSKMLRAQRRWIGSQARFSPPSLPYSLTSTCRRWTGYSCSVRSCRGFLTCRVMIVTADAMTSVAARRANWVRPTADRNWSALGHEPTLRSCLSDEAFAPKAADRLCKKSLEFRHMKSPTSAHCMDAD
jgi:hypothetical protein